MPMKNNTSAPSDWVFNGWGFDIYREIALPGGYQNFQDRLDDLWVPFSIRGFVLGVSLHRRPVFGGTEGKEGPWTNLHLLIGSNPLAPGERREEPPLFYENYGGGMKVLHNSRRDPNRYTRHIHFAARGDANGATSEPPETDALISAWRRQERITLDGEFFAIPQEREGATFTHFDPGGEACPTGTITDVLGADGKAPALLNPVSLAYWRARLRARSYIEHERWNWLRLRAVDRQAAPTTAPRTA